ncbi:MAG: hypothetical protein SangKO_086970 [Sandaracinaceae bacterium]
MSVQGRFAEWIEATGVGREGVAALLKCAPSYVSLLKTGRRTPSLKIAARIERYSRRWPEGPIMAAEWAESEVEAA